MIFSLRLSSFSRILALLFVALLVTSCTCNSSFRVTPIQKKDKELACKDIILEINEVEHYREDAVNSKSVGITKMFSPYCIVSDFADASQAVKAADERIKYLGHIYELLDCGGDNRPDISQTPIPPNSPIASPVVAPAQKKTLPFRLI
jgi:hypothetical protein